MKKVNISEKVLNLVHDSEQELQTIFHQIDSQCEKNSFKVLSAFQKVGITEAHFHTTTGYGYNDLGREAIEKVFSDVLKAEDSLVRSQIISGSHALTVALFALLRPNDTLLSITGKPYDTLEEVIGIKDNPSSLKSFGVNYRQIDLLDNDFDYDQIRKVLATTKIKVIEIQRSKGYSTRKSLTISQLEKVIKFIKAQDKNVIIMIDNCYCEFVEDQSPLEVGADLIVGSLIKNLGGGIAPNGGYIAGNKDLVALAAERLNLPGEGKEVGPSLGLNKSFLQGLFQAPSVVASSLKVAVLTSFVLEKLGYQVEPKATEERADIVQNIIFNDKDKLQRYVQGIQIASPIDSTAIPVAWDMPGYTDQVIMAAGTFTQGSSIELSCDGPIRPPYIAYQQGSLTYDYGKIGLMRAIDYLLEMEKDHD